MGQFKAGCSPAENQLNGWSSRTDKAANALFTHQKNRFTLWQEETQILVVSTGRADTSIGYKLRDWMVINLIKCCDGSQNCGVKQTRVGNNRTSALCGRLDGHGCSWADRQLMPLAEMLRIQDMIQSRLNCQTKKPNGFSESCVKL